MIWQPKKNQRAKINYKDKSMPCQGLEGRVVAVGSGKGPKNVLVFFRYDVKFYEVIPRGNLNEIM